MFSRGKVIKKIYRIWHIIITPVFPIMIRLNSRVHGIVWDTACVVMATLKTNEYHFAKQKYK